MSTNLEDNTKNILTVFQEFFAARLSRRFFYLVCISLFALAEFLVLGMSRHVFVFYDARDGSVVVETRQIKRASSPETAIRRYVDEALLGPVLPELAPLFPKGSRLVSLLFRGGTVYADISQDALFPVEGGDVFRSCLTLNKGIRRNFPSVKDVKLFIGGNEIFFSEFSKIFAEPADNNVKTGQKALTN
ncbi:MAG: GerMN domain-containing protein [Treponema sp.]|jgi:hypothetical protein|nr:GerMN domain-containing protein [Treponema sp.]